MTAPTKSSTSPAAAAMARKRTPARPLDEAQGQQCRARADTELTACAERQGPVATSR
jgi:hypothetical protein